MSTPPGARGPPSAVQRRPFFRIHASKFSFCSLVRRKLGSATPCRMLWLFFVVRNTLGDGLGTYLRIQVRYDFCTLMLDRQLVLPRVDTHQAQSTSIAVKNRMSA